MHRLIAENGIASEMPAIPFTREYATKGRAHVALAAARSDEDALRDYIEAYVAFAIAVEQYRVAHGLSLPLVDDVVPRFPWQQGASLLQATRKWCLEMHFLWGLELMCDVLFLKKLVACGVPPQHIGVPGSEVWTTLAGGELKAMVALFPRLSLANTYPDLLLNTSHHMTWDARKLNDNPLAQEEARRGCTLLREMADRLSRNGLGLNPETTTCGCSCGAVAL